MAATEDTKISDLTAITAGAATDVLVVVQSGSSSTNIITRANFFTLQSGETINIGSGTITGDLTFANANPEILGADTDGVLYIAPSTTNALGGNILLYGDTHSTKADDIEFRDTATVTLHYDKSATTWDFQANDLVTTGLIRKSVTDSITAGSTQTQAGATALTTDINRVTVVATASDGVKLPTAAAGLEILIINDDSTDALQVWPNTSDAIDGGAADAVDSNTLAAGSSRRYIAVDATDWYTA